MITFYQTESLCQITHPPPTHHLAVDGTYYALRTKLYTNYQNKIETQRPLPPNFTNTPRHLNKGMVIQKIYCTNYQKAYNNIQGIDVFLSNFPASTPYIVKRRLLSPDPGTSLPGFFIYIGLPFNVKR